MTPNRYATVRKEALRIAIEAGLPQSVAYLRTNGIKPTKHMITEIKFVARIYKRQYVS